MAELAVGQTVRFTRGRALGYIGPPRDRVVTEVEDRPMSGSLGGETEQWCRLDGLRVWQPTRYLDVAARGGVTDPPGAEGEQGPEFYREGVPW